MSLRKLKQTVKILSICLYLEDGSVEEKRTLERFIRKQLARTTKNPPLTENLIDYSVLGDNDLNLVCENGEFIT